MIVGRDEMVHSSYSVLGFRRVFYLFGDPGPAVMGNGVRFKTEKISSIKFVCRYTEGKNGLFDVVILLHIIIHHIAYNP